jgi:flagellar hook-associated protein 1 FlgK
MSLSAALNSSLSSLLTLQQQSRVASANVANAQTAGYTRKNVNLITPAVQGLPTGVAVQSVTRAVNQTLQNELYARNSEAAANAVQQQYMERIGSFLSVQDGTPRVTTMFQAFQQAWKDYEANPENATLARAVSTQGQLLATEINNLAAQPKQIDALIQTDINQNLTQLNQLVTQAYSINAQLVNQSSTGQPIGELQDQMDQVVSQISKITKVQVLGTGTAALQVLTAGGQTLVSGAVPPSFSYNPNTNQIQVTINGGTQPVQNTAFAGGQLDALLRLRAGYESQASTSTFSQTVMSSSDPSDGALRKYVNQIDAIANQIAYTVNSTYNKSASYGNELAANFFTFSTLAIPASATTATTITSGTASAGTAGGGLTDGAAAFGALTPTAANYYRVTITDGLGKGSSAIITANTATSITAPGLAATDATSRYTIQQVTGPLMTNAATAGTTTTLTDTTNTWTANAFQPTATGIAYQVRIISGTGAGQVAQITGNTANQLTVSPAFTTAPGAGSVYVIEPAYGNNPPAASMLQINPTLANGAVMTKKGAAGDMSQALNLTASATFDPIPIPTGVAALNNTGIVTGAMTISNTIGSAVSYTARSIAGSQNTADYSETLRHQTDQSYRNTVGVSIDQEMASLVTLQNAYQASAQVLQTVRTMFDTLINLGRG